MIEALNGEKGLRGLMHEIQMRGLLHRFVRDEQRLVDQFEQGTGSINALGEFYAGKIDFWHERVKADHWYDPADMLYLVFVRAEQTCLNLHQDVPSSVHDAVSSFLNIDDDFVFSNETSYASILAASLHSSSKDLQETALRRYKELGPTIQKPTLERWVAELRYLSNHHDHMSYDARLHLERIFSRERSFELVNTFNDSVQSYKSYGLDLPFSQGEYDRFLTHAKDSIEAARDELFPMIISENVFK